MSTRGRPRHRPRTRVEPVVDLRGRSSQDPVGMAVATREPTALAFDPFSLGPYGQELLRRRVMLAPVLVVWQYRVRDRDRFVGWLATREILLSEGRMYGDAELAGITYAGTYGMSPAAGAEAGAQFKTMWGYATDRAMQAMHRLCGDDTVSPTIVQLELIDFVQGLRTFIAEAGTHHFAQEVLVAAEAGRR